MSHVVHRTASTPSHSLRGESFAEVMVSLYSAIGQWIWTNALSWIIYIQSMVVPAYLAFGVVGLSGFGEITHFDRHNTFYYRLSPTTKMFLAFSVAIVASVGEWWLGLLLTVVILFSYMTLYDARKKTALAGCLALALVWSAGWSAGLYTNRFASSVVLQGGASVWAWPSYFTYLGIRHPLSLQAVYLGAAMYARYVGVVLAALIIVMTSTPSEVIRSFRKLRVPMPLIFSLLVGVRTVPRIFRSLDLTLKVLFMRGFGIRAPRFLYPLYVVVGMLIGIIPAMIFLFREAKNVAISAGTKAFGAYRDRTYLKKTDLTKDDFAVLVLAGLLIVLALVSAY